MCSKFVAVFWVAIVMAAQTPAEKPASVEGAVLNSVSGEPIRKAEVSLANGNITEEMAAMMRQLPNAPKIPGQTVATKTLAATTDSNGKFRFENVPAGTYFLKIKKVGFGEASKDSLTVTAGQAVTKLDFKLVPNGTISGRVVDEDGDPYPTAMVTAQIYTYMGARKRLVPLDTGQTNPKGEFTLSKLPPGTYLIAADVQNFELSASDAETAYVRTYYPGTIEPSEAQKTELAAGAEVNGITIQMHKGKVVKIKGKLMDAAGAPITNAQLMLMGASRMGSMSMKMVNDPEGKFEIGNLQPGTYTAMVMQMQGGSPKMNMIPLIVPDKNVDDLRLAPKPDGAIQGTVTVDRGDKVSLKTLKVMLSADEAIALMPSNASVEESGKFTLEHVTPAVYDVTVHGLPQGTYLKSVTFNGREVLGEPIDCSAAAAGNLHIVLGGDPGKLDVTVLNGEKRAAGARVVLLPADPAHRLPVNIQDGTAADSGQVTLDDVPPGDYLALAWQKIEEDQWLDPDFVKKYEDRAVKVRVASKGADKIELKVQ